MSRFDADPRDVVDLVAAYPLAWVLSGDPAGSAATPLPLLAELGEDGRIASFLGHFARSNPQVRALEGDPRATLLFQGPQGYISPSWVSKPRWGATWNYAVARFQVEIAFVPEETGAAVWRLAEAVEPEGPSRWTPAAMGERYDALIQHIVAFRATVLSSSARFKLGQDETAQTLEEIIAGTDDEALAAWMTRMARHR